MEGARLIMTSRVFSPMLMVATTFDTGFPADSLEFCPNRIASDIFVCGTYKLDEDSFSAGNQRTGPQHRRGQCLVFQVSNAVDASGEIQ